LRRELTNAEQHLWQHLRAVQLGAKFRRQFSVDAYVIDFYAPRYKLAVEVDGDSHYTDSGVNHDEERTRHLEKFGIEVLRFTNPDVLHNIEGVVAVIEEALVRGKPPPNPLLGKEGGPEKKERG
jgi:very-short-patch-repair endonuclease